MEAGRALSLRDLEAFDPQAPARGIERRFLCPLCHGDRSRTAAHRSLAANTDTGAWQCHRCGAGGKLRDRWEDRPHDRRQRARQQLHRVFTLSPAPTTSKPSGNLPEGLECPRPPALPSASVWRDQLRALQILEGTPGAAYLSGRGIPLDVAHRAQVRFAPDWYGRPAVVFPVRDRQGKLVAAQGRYTDGKTNPKTRTAGPVASGAFVPPGALDGDVVIITEAPVDALSLAACGHPAVATLGCNLPDWLRWACAFRRVMIATDADQAGDAAAAKWESVLLSAGARVTRLRPVDAKDWNEWRQRDSAGLQEWLRAEVEATVNSLQLEASGALSNLDNAEEPEMDVGHDWTAAGIGALLDAARDLGAVLSAAGDDLHIQNADEIPEALLHELHRREAMVVLWIRDEEGDLPVTAGAPALFDVESEDDAPSPWR